MEQVGQLSAFISAYISSTRKVLEQLLDAERGLEEMCVFMVVMVFSGSVYIAVLDRCLYSVFLLQKSTVVTCTVYKYTVVIGTLSLFVCA